MKITIGKKEAAERLYRIDEMHEIDGSFRAERDAYGNKVSFSNLFIAISSTNILETTSQNIYVIDRTIDPHRYKGWLFRRTNEPITISFEE